MTDKRRLIDLVSVGKATVEDLKVLGIKSVSELALRDPNDLFEKLCKFKKAKLDPCCLDVFVAAIEQARNPNLSAEKKDWWYWSSVRKAKPNIQKT